jgi:hypothetical protein
MEAMALDNLREYKCPPCEQKLEKNDRQGLQSLKSGGQGLEESEKPNTEGRRQKHIEQKKRTSRTDMDRKGKRKVEYQPEKSKFSDYRPETDGIRKSVIEGLTLVLETYSSPTLPSDGGTDEDDEESGDGGKLGNDEKSSDDGGTGDGGKLGNDEKSSDDGGTLSMNAFTDCTALAIEIERELFTQLADPEPTLQGGIVTRCGHAYKAKYRTLQFNLKDPKNGRLRAALFRGRTTPARLVTMNTQEMANEEVKQVIRHVREASITQFTIPDGAIEGLVVKKTHKGEDYIEKPAEPDNTVLASHGMVGEKEFSKPLTSNSKAKSKAGDKVASQIKSSTKSPTSDSIEWRGKIYLAEVGRVAVSATLLTSSSGTQTNQTFLKTMPVNLHVSGRIPVEVASEYVNQIWSGSNTRDVLMFKVRETMLESESVDTTSLGVIIKNLRENNRWAVVAHDGKVRDFYLVPVGEESDMGMLPMGVEAELPVLMGIIVVGKDGKVVKPNVNPVDLYEPQ